MLREGEPWGEFEFALAGEYNVVNATAAAAMAAHYGIDPPVIAEALKIFQKREAPAGDQGAGGWNYHH